MTIEELMWRHRTRSELHHLTVEEREVHDNFLGLGETKEDLRILSLAWLKCHAEKVR